MQVDWVDVRRFDDTVEAEIRYTWLAWVLVKSSQFSIRANRDDWFSFQVSKLTRQEEKQLLFRSKFFRKLRLIEATYDFTFSLPIIFTMDDLKRVDRIFRGITEGEFSIIAEGVDVSNFSVTNPSSLNGAPFVEPGMYTWDGGRTEVLFGKELPVGPHQVSAGQALLADPDAITKLSIQTPTSVHFSVLDYQLHYRFEKYAAQRPEERRQKLVQFKNKYLKDDPQELTDLVDQPLADWVTAAEAVGIASNWLRLHGLSNRYVATEPMLEGQQWQVPIMQLDETSGFAAGHRAFVNVTSGELTTQIAAGELQKHVYPPKRSIWEKIEASIQKVPNDMWDALPTDGAEQHDHYLYGSPKK